MLAFFVGMVVGPVVLFVILSRVSLARCLRARARALDKAACDIGDVRGHRGLHVAAAICRCVAADQYGALEVLYARALQGPLPSPDELRRRLEVPP